MFARSYCVFIATIMTAGIKLQYAPFTLKKKFVKADYHLPKVVPAEDAFFSIFHSLGQLLSFFHSFFPFYCFFLFVLRLIPTSVFLSHFLSALKRFSLYLKRKKKNTKIPTHGIIFLLKDKNKRRDKFRFFFLFMCYLLSAASFSFWYSVLTHLARQTILSRWYAGRNCWHVWATERQSEHENSRYVG